MSEPGQTEPGQAEQRLLRLCLGLKMLFWTMCMITLIIGIWEVATGRSATPPMLLVWTIAGLGAAQIGAWLVWFSIRRTRLNGNKQ